MLGSAAALAQNKYFADWPAGTDPRDVGKRVAERFIPTPHMEMPGHGPQALHYSHVATWVGALQFAGVTQDADLAARLAARFEPFLAPDAPRVPRSDHVDADVFGALPLELYLQTHRYQYRVMGLAFADAQWDNPDADGYTHQTRWWIDDMYMITELQLQAYRATGEAKYLERAAREMVAYLREAAAAQRTLLPRAGREVLLGPRRRLGGGGHDRDAARAAGEAQRCASPSSRPIAR